MSVARITELLEANNREVARRRAAVMSQRLQVATVLMAAIISPDTDETFDFHIVTHAVNLADRLIAQCADD